MRTVLCLLGVLLLASPALSRNGLPAGTQAPSQAEADLFAAILARIVAQQQNWPTDVSDVVGSLTGTHTVTITCPSGSAVTKVVLNITTTHVAWDANLAVQDSQGTYNWDASASVAAGVKTVTCQNWVMIDPGVAGNEDADFGKAGNEALLYHELLHGQLLIDEMADADWVADVCKCNFDDTAADSTHTTIFPEVDKYIEAIAPGVDITVINVSPEQAAEDCTFDIKICPAAQKVWQSKLRQPSTGGNIDFNSLTVTVGTDGCFHVTGKLIDCEKPGKIFVWIDPPVQWVYLGLETAITILPPDHPGWNDKGFALAGQAGEPLLVGTGTLAASTSNAVDLSNAAPTAPAALFLAFASTPVPFKGGTLVPFPFLTMVITSTTPGGTFSLPFAMPLGVPPATNLWVQWAIQDAGAVSGVALSNALLGLTP